MEQGPLNPETLETLKEYADPGEPRFLADLFRSYLEDGAARLDAIRAAAGAGDTVAIARIAHTLKGSCLNVGADPLADLLNRIDKAAKAGELPDEGALRACAEEFARVRSALGPYLG